MCTKIALLISTIAKSMLKIILSHIKNVEADSILKNKVTAVLDQTKGPLGTVSCFLQQFGNGRSSSKQRRPGQAVGFIVNTFKNSVPYHVMLCTQLISFKQTFFLSLFKRKENKTKQNQVIFFFFPKSPLICLCYHKTQKRGCFLLKLFSKANKFPLSLRDYFSRNFILEEK